MTGSQVLDVVLALILLGQTVRGWRRGAVVGVLGLVGLIGGAWAGLRLSVVVADWLPTSSPVVAGFARVAVFLALAEIGEALGVALGRVLGASRLVIGLRGLDSAIGAVVSLAVASLVLTVGATAVRPVAPVGLARAMDGSVVLRTTQQAVPPAATRAATRAVGVLVDGFPRVFSGVGDEPQLPVGAPDDATVTPAVKRASASVVRVLARSQSCSRESEGSGWVSDPRRVVTNAHVVAGATSVGVQVGGKGPLLPATVVHYDPDLDLAVLRVADLTAAPLTMAASVAEGQGVVVAGFPLDGPYRLSPARVRGRIDARGENIYGTRTVTRQVLAVRGTVQPGNSGGPLLTEQGTVAGTVFARSTTEAQTGYVLSNEATRASVKAGDAATTPTSTQQCTPEH